MLQADRMGELEILNWDRLCSYVHITVVGISLGMQYITV